MKKITIISDFYPPHWTGIAKSIQYISENLTNDYLVKVLTVKFNKDLSQKEISNNFKIFRYPSVVSFSRAKLSLSLIIAFIKNVSNTDIVLINSPSAHILLISLITKLFKKKLLIFHQGDLILPKGIINSVIEKIFDFSSFLSFSFADQLATYTQDYAQNSRLLSKFSNKTTAFIPPLPYFLNDKRQHKADGKIKNKLQKLKKQKKYLIGFAGRFVEEKGFDTLLEACLLLRKKRDDFYLIFAGEKIVTYENTFEKYHHLIRQLDRHLIVLGLLNDEELLSFYKSIDFFVLPSRSECFALVQAEAMSQKTPVLVSDIPGARDPVKQSSFGMLFDVDNAKDLANKIEQMLIKLNNFDKEWSKTSKYFDYDNSRKKLFSFIRS